MMNTVNTVANVVSYFSNKIVIGIETELQTLELRFKRQTDAFTQIKDMIEIREELEERITSVLSDYTQMINQVSIVATLTLAMALGAFGSLLGNTDNQPMWKISLFTISCVGTTLFSILSVLESFFLSIHINQVEARFASGTSPHVARTRTSVREFHIDDLIHLNSTFNFIVITFFIAFLSFSTTLLGYVYLGLGLSNNVFQEDTRQAVPPELFPHDFPNATTVPLYKLEPGFVPIASMLTTIVVTVYVIIGYRFFTVYVNYIHTRSLISFLLIFGCQKPEYDSHNAKTPIRIAADRFNNLQTSIFDRIQKWRDSTESFLFCVEQISRDRRVETKTQQQQAGTLATDLWKWSDSISEYCKHIVKKMNDMAAPRDSDVNTATKRKLEHCKYYTQSVMDNMELLKQFKASEHVEQPQLYIYDMKPCAPVLAILIFIWGVTGGLILTLLSFICAILILSIIKYCPCCCCGIKLKHCKTVTEITLMHYEDLHKATQHLYTRRSTSRDGGTTTRPKYSMYRDFEYRKISF